MNQKRSLLERLFAGTVHLVAMFGVLHFAVNLIGFPIFPRTTLYWLIPHAVVLLVSFRWSRFVFAHAIGACSFHLGGLTLAFIPVIFRTLSAAGLLGERWYYTGWMGYSTTPIWGWMVMIMIPVTIFTFGLTGDAAVKGYDGQNFDYPLIGRLTSRLSR